VVSESDRRSKDGPGQWFLVVPGSGKRREPEFSLAIAKTAMDNGRDYPIFQELYLNPRRNLLFRLP
jgi:hypothetical protein